MPAIVIPAPISSNHAAPVSAGGTGATTAAAARTNLDVYSKSEVTNAISQSTAIGVWNQRATYWYWSNTSFTDAINKIETSFGKGYAAAALEKIASEIGDRTNATVSNIYVPTAGPVYGATLEKVNNNYYAGMLFSYYSELFVAFRYQNGDFYVRLI